MPTDLLGGFKNYFGFTEEREEPAEAAAHPSYGKKWAEGRLFIAPAASLSGRDRFNKRQTQERSFPIRKIYCIKPLPRFKINIRPILDLPVSEGLWTDCKF
jgi:hypothetical protein